jgi:hypothetical protein
MVAVEARELSVIALGDAYCTVVEGCAELFDTHRAATWTAALRRWCDQQPELVLYRTECLVHRAELMQLHGAWAEALHELEEFATRIAGPATRLLGALAYLRGDLSRLTGELDNAEQAYRSAAQLEPRHSTRRRPTPLGPGPRAGRRRCHPTGVDRSR